ncbi:hypothetical protein M0R45_020451 [Rubus argutus]|uniref:Uncharacterized protein n=1 Tax=Rubus argutus TaxID=59490 RepID=A0AAW1XA19_RUBAR
MARPISHKRSLMDPVSETCQVVARTFFGIDVVVVDPHFVAADSAPDTLVDALAVSIAVHIVGDIVAAVVDLVAWIRNVAGIAPISAWDLLMGSCLVALVQVVARTFFDIDVVVASPHVVASDSAPGTPVDALAGSIVVHIVGDIVAAVVDHVAWIRSVAGIAPISAQDLLMGSCLVLLVQVVAHTFFDIDVVVADPHFLASDSAPGTLVDALAGSIVVHIVGDIVAAVDLVAWIRNVAGIAPISAQDLLMGSCLVLLVQVVARTFFGIDVVVANPHFVASDNVAGRSADALAGSTVVHIVDDIVVVVVGHPVAWIHSAVGIPRVSVQDLCLC